MSTPLLFEHRPHPRSVVDRPEPPRVADELTRSSPVARVNAWLAVKISAGVGTMWCAYAFATLALLSLPAAIATGALIVIVAWVAQTFLQLVLLSIIIVGQNIQAGAADKRAEQTYLDAEAVLHEALEIQRHLEAQDAALAALTAPRVRTRVVAVPDRPKPPPTPPPPPRPKAKAKPKRRQP